MSELTRCAAVLHMEVINSINTQIDMLHIIHRVYIPNFNLFQYTKHFFRTLQMFKTQNGTNVKNFMKINFS